MKAMRGDIAWERLRSLLRYYPKTGGWKWLVDRDNGKVKAGSEAGCIKNGKGGRRRHICIDDVRYRASRLAYFYMKGFWPKNEIDHVNGDTLDDRWENLRQATYSQNLANQGSHRDNKTGFKGVTLSPRGKYLTQITVNRKKTNGGYFATPEEAHARYKELAIKHFGEFARW
jgi:hypothetical protein